MDEQFDKDIINRIKEVFDKHHDPSADEGWLLLRKKFPEERSRRPAAWWWRGVAAAILLLCMGIGFLIYDGRVQPKKMAHQKTKLLTSQSLVKTGAGNPNDSAVTGSEDRGKPANQANKDGLGKLLNAAASNTGKLARSPEVALHSGHHPNSSRNAVINERKYLAKSPMGKTGIKQAVALTPPILAQQNLENIPDGQRQLSKGNPANAIALAKNPAIAGKTTDSATHQRLAAGNIKTRTDSAAIKQPAAKSPNAMFTAAKQIDVPKNDHRIKSDSKKVRFAVYEATYFNYAKGSSNQVNVGAGFTSDIPLTNNLKLVTGVTIAQNSLNFTGTPPAYIQQNDLVVASTPLAAASFAGPSASVAKIASPTFQNYNASLIGLDIPLNLKYVFNPQKNDTYISAGVSSGTFIDETYTYKYNYPAFFSPTLQQTQGATAHSSFNGFYFAKTLNVAFGVGYPFGRNRLIIEPFLKYPLDGMGAQQLRFGAGGVNLKYNFSQAKK